MDVCHLKNSELEPQFQKYKGRVVLQGDIVKDDSGSYAVFTERGSSASRLTAARVMDVISRLPGCAGQAADAISAYTQVRNGRCTIIVKKRSQNVQIFGYVYQNTKRPKSWSSMEDPVVPLERNLYGHPLAGLLWERQFEKILLKHGWAKIPNWECLFVHREKGLFLSVYVDDIKLAGKRQNLDPMWKVLNREVDLGEPTSFLDHVYLGCTQRHCEISKDIVDNYRTMFESKISAGATEKLPYSEKLGANISSWSYDMEGHAKKCVEEYCELANKQLNNYTKSQTPCIDDHQFKEEELGSVGELSKVCSQIVLKCLCLARIGRPDILWSVNKLARAITKWTRACDKRLARLISYIHHTCEFKIILSCGKHGTTMQIGTVSGLLFCRKSRRLKKSSSRGVLCIFGSHTFVPISWMYKKQTSVSHRSTEAEIIFLSMQVYAWMEFQLLIFWDLVVEVFHSSPNQLNKIKDHVRGNSSRNTTSNKHTENQTKVPTQHDNLDLSYVDYVSSKRSLLNLVRCCIFLRTTKQWLKWSSKAEVQQWDTDPEPTELLFTGCLTEFMWTTRFKSSMSTPNTNLQTYWQKGIFTRNGWNNLLPLFNISHFSLLCFSQSLSLTSCTKTMAKRTQEQEGEERIVAKSKPTMNLAFTVSTSSSTVKNTIASKSPGELGAPCQNDWRSTRKPEAREFIQARRSVDFSRMAKRCSSGCKDEETRRDRKRPGTPEFPWRFILN